MSCRWTILEYTHSWVGNSLHITIVTDNEVTLTLQFTEKPSRVRLRTVTVRGLRKLGHADYCFVEFGEITQHEEGDTLVHNFTIANWPYGAPGSFVVRGSVDGLVCISLSPIIKFIEGVQGAADSSAHTALTQKDPNGRADHYTMSIRAFHLAWAIDAAAKFFNAYTVQGRLTGYWVRPFHLWIEPCETERIWHYPPTPLEVYWPTIGFDGDPELPAQYPYSWDIWFGIDVNEQVQVLVHNTGVWPMDKVRIGMGVSYPA